MRFRTLRGLFRPMLLVGAVAGDQPRNTLPVDIAGGTFEASGVALIPGSNFALFVDDGRPSEAFLIEIGRDERQRGEAVRVRLDANVTDFEGLTTDGSFYYAVGSQSKLTGHDGDGFVRFAFDTGRRMVRAVERIRNLKGWLADHVPELAGTQHKLGDDVVNIEALAWDPVRSRFLLGLRAPVIDGHALVVPVRFADSTAGFVRENLRLDGATIRLDLDGAGIRSLEYDSSRRTFHVISGASLNTEDRDFRVLAWSGTTTSPDREVARYPAALKPEGITTGAVHGRNVRLLVFDVGKFALLRDTDGNTRGHPSTIHER